MIEEKVLHPQYPVCRLLGPSVINCLPRLSGPYLALHREGSKVRGLGCQRLIADSAQFLRVKREFCVSGAFAMRRGC